jgi:ornithine decarboxylase
MHSGTRGGGILVYLTLTGWGIGMIQSYGGAAAMIRAFAPELPIVGIRPHLIRERARAVLDAFPGDVLYAVKCNDHPVVLEALYAAGVRQFDTASIKEIRLVRRLLPDAVCHFMHPVKSSEAIAEAYAVHGVRRFVLDHPRELDKIVAATGGARDLELFVRLVVPGDGALLTLTGKFGTGPEEAVALLRTAQTVAQSTGITFHVGSQCTAPEAFEQAIEIAAVVAAAAGGVDHLDVGGGFPAAYRGDEPPFEAFVASITRAMQRHGLAAALQCEPGRLLVADGASVFARVELRRGQALYLNDGVYGNLAELKWVGPQFPTRALGVDGQRHGPDIAFDLFGPTCDSIDSMPGPHWLAADVVDGDWIEVGMMGAYSSALRTDFNGFAECHTVLLDDGVWFALEAAAPAPLRRAA